MKIKQASRLTQLPPYLFAELDRKRDEVAARGVDIIDLGVGDPDLPTPAPVVEAMVEAVRDADTHHYPSYQGMRDFRVAAAEFMGRRFGVELDPDTQICALIGSKEGLAHAPLAMVEPGDAVLYPSPGYPVYRIATIFAGGKPVSMPLSADNNWLPDFTAIDKDDVEQATMMYLNYPNNPTGAIADGDFFKQTVSFAHEHELALLHDAAYSELCFDEYSAPSVLQQPGAIDVAAEFHSLSKTANMTGWRIGFVAGNAEIVGAVGRIKTNIDSGAFEAVQRAAITALDLPEKIYRDILAVYKERRDVVVDGLRRAGIEVEAPQATFYVWFPVPGGDSAAFAGKVLEQTGVVLTPGIGFGAEGEGYARIALCRDTERLAEAMERIVRT